MNRLTLKFFSAFSAVFLLSGFLHAQSLEKLARKLTKGIKDGGKIAVLDFPYHNGRLSGGSSIVQERLTTFIAQHSKIEVIERNLLQKILEEKKLEQTGLIDPSTTRELGRILGVETIITGTLND